VLRVPHSVRALAVQTVQPPLEKFYGLLNDEQKARLTALNSGRNARSDANANCNAPQVAPWPSAEIDRVVRPTDAQRAGLAALQEAAAKASDMLKDACAPANAMTPPARLAAVKTRLDTMLTAIKTVRGPLDSFYASLNDEQKASFDSIGPQRGASQRVGAMDQMPDAQVVDTPRHRHHASAYGMQRAIIRNVMSMIRY